MEQEIKASQNMKKFFDNLLKIKSYVKNTIEELEDSEKDVFLAMELQKIYDMLNQTIKSTEENA